MVKLIKARLSDVEEMQELVKSEVKEGIILERGVDEIAQIFAPIY
jgi:N-acetylglutamate synthase-like GNAT family acetyltransferase